MGHYDKGVISKKFIWLNIFYSFTRMHNDITRHVNEKGFSQ